MVNEQEYSKPTFDGRLQYYQVIKELLVTFSISHLSGNNESSIRTIEAMFFLTFPFLQNNKAEKIENRIKRSRILLLSISKNKHNSSKTIIELNDLLFNLKKDIMIAMKNLLLPTMEQDIDPMMDEEFLRKFERESDL